MNFGEKKKQQLKLTVKLLTCATIGGQKHKITVKNTICSLNPFSFEFWVNFVLCSTATAKPFEFVLPCCPPRFYMYDINKSATCKFSLTFRVVVPTSGDVNENFREIIFPINLTPHECTMTGFFSTATAAEVHGYCSIWSHLLC